MQLFGSSGIRGIVDRELVHLAWEIGLSVGGLYRSVVVGQDTRSSSDAMKYALISGLLCAGCRTYDAGTTPTPVLAYITSDFEAGIMITASHNPPEYNGIKLLNRDGSAFDHAQRNQIEETISEKAFRLSSWKEMEGCRPYPGAIGCYIDRILKDFDQIRIRAVVDSGNGVASLVTPYILEKIGCEVISLNCHPSGYSPRRPEPTEENLAHLAEVVKMAGADIGIAHDGDGDRLAVIDEKGSFIPGDKLMALFARHLGVKRLVTTVDASMAIEELGFEVLRTRVGDSFVSEELRKGGDFGGEPSGCWIFPNISYCPDGIYAAAKVAELASKEKISALVDELPSYPLLRGSILGDRSTMTKLRQRLASISSPPIDTTDGIRLAFEDGWLLVRASGTEPKIRVTAEARSQRRAEELYNLAIKALEECR